MTQVSEKVLAWLYNVLQDYADTRKTYNDVARSLALFSTLAPRTEVHTYENGASLLLLTLSGTLPTDFRGTTYQFPVKVWLPRNYPREPPFLYVNPGRDMQIRAGQHIGVDGRIYHPYLRDWSNMLERASIAELLGCVQQVFSKEPPVMSRNAARPEPARAQPPLPPKQYGIAEMPSISTPPPRPPKSTADQDLANVYSAPPQRNTQRDGPPLPPLPAQRSASTTLNHTTYTQTYDRPGPQGQLYQSGSQIQDARRVYSPPLQGQQHRAMPRAPSQSYIQASQTPPSQFAQHMHNAAANLRYANGTTGQADSRHISYMMPQAQQRRPAQDLLSDPFDVALPTVSAAPPPVPVNPEKEHLLQALSATLVQQAQQKVNQNVSALTPLYAQQNALRAAYSRLEAELVQMQSLDNAIANNEAILRRSLQECDHTIEAAKTKSQPPIDDVLVAQTLVAQQLWTASAEEAACREAMYVLQKAVDKGRVNGSDFVRQMRGLSRECFLQMALAKKCARGMGLETQR